MKIIIFIPTYNEKENICILIDRIIDLYPEYYILIVDDNSPDGTANIIKQNYKKLLNKKIYLIIRTQNRGRGLAGIEGYRNSLLLGADIIIEMDGDLSHRPEYIKEMLKYIPSYDVIIGSRYVKEGTDSQRSILRKLISFLAKFYIKFILGIHLKDPTSGFRVFKKEVIEKILPYLNASDPFIVTEVYYYTKLFGFKNKEIPIIFYKRFKGKTKLNKRILLKYLFNVLKLKFKTKINKKNQ